jgi:hypothetical protein
MSRGLTSPQLAAVAASHRVVVPALEMMFDSGALRLALCPWEIVAGIGTFQQTGDALNIEAIEESSSGMPGLRFTMSGLNPDIITIATAEPYRGRLVRLYKAYLDSETHALVGTMRLQWVGRMRNIPITETNSTCTVTVDAENYDLALTRAMPRRWNDADQQRRFPGDRGCEYAAQMTEKFLPFPAKEALRK